MLAFAATSWKEKATAGERVVLRFRKPRLAVLKACKKGAVVAFVKWKDQLMLSGLVFTRSLIVKTASAV